MCSATYIWRHPSNSPFICPYIFVKESLARGLHPAFSIRRVCWYASKPDWQGNDSAAHIKQQLSKANFKLPPEQTQLALAQHTNSLTARWWSSEAEQTRGDNWFPDGNVPSVGILLLCNTWTDSAKAQTTSGWHLLVAFTCANLWFYSCWMDLAMKLAAFLECVHVHTGLLVTLRQCGLSTGCFEFHDKSRRSDSLQTSPKHTHSPSPICV